MYIFTRVVAGMGDVYIYLVVAGMGDVYIYPCCSGDG